MKRVLIYLMIAVIALIAAGCAKEADQPSGANTASEPAAQQHTVQPEKTDDQLEWAPVDSKLVLENSQYVYAEDSDFLAFALVGSSDEDCALKFSLDDVTAGMLSQQADLSGCFLSLDGEKLNGSLTFGEDFKTLTLKGGYSYSDTCSLASKIRGL